MGVFVRHEPCDACGSSDAKGVYEDGSAHCFACKRYFHPDGKEEGNEALFDGRWSTGRVSDIPKRGLKEATCARYGYQVGEGCQIAPYRNDKRQLVAQKIRRAGKEFSIEGDGKNIPLFGQHLFNGGKSVVITEGEVDCLSIAQAFDCKWPVVSLPNGAQSAAKALKRAYEWLCGFEKVVLCFDADEPGEAALAECLPLLPPGTAYVMRLERKDANDVLLHDGSGPLVKAYWNATRWKPDGIVDGSDITLESLLEATALGYDLRYPRLNELLGGLRKREITMLTAGSGIGKSTLAREIAYGLHQDHGLTIGNVYLEESKEKTAQAYVALHNNVPLKALRKDPNVIRMEDWRATMEAVIQQRMYFYDHFGSLDSERLLSQFRYMAVVLRCDFIILDHISIVISGTESSSEGERRDIDRLMTALRSLVEETGVGLVVITHLKQPEGRGHEEGGRVTLTHLRGSGSLKQLSDSVIALERDQQGDEPNQCTVRVLKNREGGDVGLADTLEFNKETGRLLPLEGVMGEVLDI